MGHGIERVDHGEDSARDGDLLGLEPVRIAGAVAALVMTPHHVQRGREQRHGLQKLDSPLRMPLDGYPLVGRKGLRLLQNSLRHADLSDVVQEGPQLERLTLRWRKLQVVGHGQRSGGQPAKRARFRPPRFERASEDVAALGQFDRRRDARKTTTENHDSRRQGGRAPGKHTTSCEPSFHHGPETRPPRRRVRPSPAVDRRDDFPASGAVNQPLSSPSFPAAHGRRGRLP
jgi:hypothetical protein